MLKAKKGGLRPDERIKIRQKKSIQAVFSQILP
jgi:hypothetical protein